MTIRYVSGTSLAALSLMLAASPAHAQDATGTSAAPASSQEDALKTEEIVVTGSLIVRSRDQAAPVDVLSSDDLRRMGSPSTVDLLKNLPTSNGVLGDAGAFDSRSAYSEGTASVNLRGLGPQRTLVLLNGRRMAQSAGQPIPYVDINLIPTAALDRVEILKDGAAATYGSDAVAGVVNFITRRDDGFRISGDYRYIRSSDGDYTGGVSYGKVGNGYRFLLSAGYQHRSQLLPTERDFAVRPYAENPQGGYSGGGNPGNFDFNGTLGGLSFTADRGCTTLGGFESLAGSATDRCLTNFVQYSNLVEREDRYQIYAEGEIGISSKAKFKVTGLYGYTDGSFHTPPTYLPTQGPSANAQGGGSGTYQIPTYAPALRDYCRVYGAAAGCSVDGAGSPLAPALASPLVFRPALLGGNPLYASEENTRASAEARRRSETFRVTAELGVELNDALRIDAGFTYGEYRREVGTTDAFGDLLQNALAGFGGENCAFASPASRAGLSNAQIAAVAGTNGCLYFNPLSTAIPFNTVTGQVNPLYAGSRGTAGLSTTPGAGLINDASVFGSFFRTSRSISTTSIYIGDAVLSGRTGIELPGGPVQFAAGMQFRKDTLSRVFDANSNLANNPCPGTPLNPAATCSPQTGAFAFLGTNLDQNASSNVYALFGELQLPIFDPLEMQLSARYEKYDGGVGSTFNPQARAKFKVTRWLSLRGGVGTTFRGPPAQQQSGSATSLVPIGSGFRAVDIVGNPNLRPERATTFGGGIVVLSGGLNASVDYFNYTLKGPIEAEPVAGIVNALFGASGTANCGNSAYAALQARFTFGGAGCSVDTVQRLRTLVVNSGKVKTSGFDVQASYQFEIGDLRLTPGAAGTYVQDYVTDDLLVEGILVQPGFQGAGLLNYQTTAYPIPRLKGSAYLQTRWQDHSLRFQLNHIAGYTDQRGAAVFGPVAALARAPVLSGKHIGAFDTVDLSYVLNLPTGTTVTLSATNIFDKDPPFARVDQNYDSLTASPLGATVKIGVSQKF